MRITIASFSNHFLPAVAAVSIASMSAALLAGCPAPEPVKDPSAHVDTEEDARLAFDQAKKADDPEALFAVYNRFKKFPSVARQALRLAGRKELDSALEASEACDQSKAEGSLAIVAPYTADDQEIDTKYDETRESVESQKKRCLIVRLDADVKRAEAAWDFPRAFDRIRNEHEIEGGLLKKRRLELLGRWIEFVDHSLHEIVSKRSVAAAFGDKRGKWDASIDPAQLPEDCAPELDKRKNVIMGVLLVFDTMQEGALIDPVVPYWTYGSPKARLATAPSGDSQTLPMGVPFQAIAKGTMGGVSWLVTGKDDGDPLTRLGSAKYLVQEDDARTYDTRAVLPENIIGMTVLAPEKHGSDLLVPSIVVSDKLGAVMVQPLAKKGSHDFVDTKRTEMRGMSFNIGQKVEVRVDSLWKKAEIADLPEADRVLVKINGFESYVPLTDVHVKRSDLPALPKEKEAKGGLLGL